MDDSNAVPPPPPPPAYGAPPPVSPPPSGAVGLGQGKLAESDEKTMGMLAHLLGGLFSFLGPLIIWLIKKDESPFVNDQGREALNFQITVLFAVIACSILSFIPYLGCIFALAWMAIVIANLVFAIIGCLEANKGVAYRYPFALRLIS